MNEGTGKYVAEINYPNELKEILKDYSSFEKEVTLLALGHDFGDFTVVKEPTCIDEGLKKKVCKMCSCEVTEAMKELGHTVNKNARCSICKEKVGKVVKEASGEKAMVRFTADEIKSLDNFSEYGFTRLSEATTIETDRYTLKLEEGVILEPDYEENLNTIIKGVEDVTGYTFTDKIIINVGNYHYPAAMTGSRIIKIPWYDFSSCHSSYPSAIIHELVHLTDPTGMGYFAEGYAELYEDKIMDYLGGKYKDEETCFTNMLRISKACGLIMDGLTEETFKSVFLIMKKPVMNIATGWQNL